MAAPMRTRDQTAPRCRRAAANSKTTGAETYAQEPPGGWRPGVYPLPPGRYPCWPRPAASRP
eukprot:1204423-Lingulodinium_polyedra.AAC.1